MPKPTDPNAEARQWVADNPQAPGAVHVLAALASAERYRLLAEVAQSDGAAGCKIVLGTLGTHLTITTTSQATDEEIAEKMAHWYRMINKIADDMAANPAPEREEPAGLRVASVGTHDFDAFREYVGLPVAVLVGSKAHIAAVAALYGRSVMVSEEEWVLPEGAAPASGKPPFAGRKPGDACGCGGTLVLTRHEGVAVPGSTLDCDRCPAGYDEDGRHYCPKCETYRAGWVGGTDADPRPNCPKCGTIQPGWRQ